MPFSSSEAFAQNRVQKLWRRFVNRPSRTQRPETVGRGGGNRDRCPFTDQELTALVPVSEELGLSYVEKTTKAYPTWYFFVPYQPRLGIETEFVLIDETEKIIYQETFPLRDTPGILKFSLPVETTGLEVNQDYRWVFSVICNPRNRSGDATVNGWIERLPAETLPIGLQDTDEINKFIFYIERLIWFDAVESLVQLRSYNFQNVEYEESWESLMEILGLESATDQINSLR